MATTTVPGWWRTTAPTLLGSARWRSADRARFWLANSAGWSARRYDQGGGLRTLRERGALPGAKKATLALSPNSKPGDPASHRHWCKTHPAHRTAVPAGLCGNAECRAGYSREIRMQARRRETSFGGTYSSIAVGIQLPMARWLLHRRQSRREGHQLKITIVTGLDTCP